MVQYYAEEGNRLYWFSSKGDRKAWVGDNPETRHGLNWHQMDKKYGRNKINRRLRGRMEPYGQQGVRHLYTVGGRE